MEDVTEGPGEWFALNLRRAREAAGRSQSEAAARARERLIGLPFSQQTLSKVESGQQRPDLIQAHALSGVVGVDLAALMQPPESGAEALRAAALAREVREVHGFAEARAAEFLRLRAELQDLAGQLAEPPAAVAAAAALRLSWEG